MCKEDGALQKSVRRGRVVMRSHVYIISTAPNYSRAQELAKIAHRRNYEEIADGRNAHLDERKVSSLSILLLTIAVSHTESSLVA